MSAATTESFAGAYGANTNNLDAHFMPFTANKQFKNNPRLLVAAEGMHYTAADGRKILDGTSGLWCVNAGHGRKQIVDAIRAQAEKMDYAPAFQMGHPLTFALAARLAALLPGDLDHVIFTNSGSESVDTALKLALAYHRINGEAGRTLLIGRERGYHGVGFGGMSVGGIAPNRRQFGSLLGNVDHLPHTHSLDQNRFSRGEPEWGIEKAEALEGLVTLHGADTIAAVIVEPMAGSTGVLIPPKGYLKRLREICDKHGILLIFDEVITGFGRLGASFASEKFGIVPDLMTMAKGISNAAVPMGGVAMRKGVYEAFMNGPDNAVDLFHGYTYSGHPLACAASMATLDIYRDEGLFERANDLAPYWEDAVHSLQDADNVIDVRNMGMVAGVELEPRAGKPTARVFDAFLKCFEDGLLVRTTGDIIALAPPLIAEKSHLDQIVDTVRTSLRHAA